MFDHSFIILGLTNRVRMAIDGAEYQTVGMIVVFGCLGLIALVLSISAAIASRIQARKQAALAAAAPSKPVAAAAPAATPAAAQEKLSPELIAVISAAVSTTLEGMNHRILEIKQSPSSGYSVSGRSEIFASHRITPTARK